jgi:hypothetical protein
MDKIEINKEYINSFRLNLGTIYWNFDKDKYKEIIPKELEHNYLLKNFKIDASIYDYYHLPMRNFLAESEYQKLKSGGFVGSKETAVKPYSHCIYGAYHFAPEFIFKLYSVQYYKSKPTDFTPRINGKTIRYFEDLLPYFNDYAAGFKNGFDEFYKVKIEPYLTPFPDKYEYVNKVFEFITKKIFFEHNWISYVKGFSLARNVNVKITKNAVNEISKGFDDGQTQGYFYRAWSMVFSQSSLFAPLFKEHLQTFKDNTLFNPSTKLSISDWSIIFYYIDESGKKEGNKKERWEKFIKENNLLGQNGQLASSGFFKSQYYKIVNRINSKEGYSPLPPERITNILTFLKKNKKAIQQANNDIEHLKIAVAEYKENKENYH